MGSPANINTLNRFAKGLFANMSDPVADFLAPQVPTGAARFYINDYGQRGSFQVPNTKRPIGGDSTAVVTDSDRVEISLKPHALHDIIDDQEIDEAGDDAEAIQLMYEARTRMLINQGANARLSEVLTVARASISGTAKTWGGSEDPVEEIDAEIKAIADSIGLMPNRILFSLSAWQLFRNNAAVIDRYPGSAQVSPQLGGVGNLFLNPEIECKVSTAVFDAKLSATTSKTNALSTDVWIFFAAPNADMYDASFAKTFQVRANAFGNVRTERKDFGDKLITSWTRDTYLNNTSAAKRLTVTSA